MPIGFSITGFLCGTKWPPRRKAPASVWGRHTCYQQLEANFNTTQTLQADIEEVRRQLQTAVVQNAELRERVLAFLISELPAGYQNPKLMDFGLRERFRSRSRVTAVATQAEPEPAPAPEPAQP